MEKLPCDPKLERKFTKDWLPCFEKANIEVKRSPIHRYGVFATKDIANKELIEECPVIIFEKLTSDYRESICDRVFYWDDKNCAIALGYGSMYNHSGDNFNAMYITDLKKQRIQFLATKPITSGTEILIDYGDGWFDSRSKRQITYKQSCYYNSLRVVLFLLFLFALSKIFPSHAKTLFTHEKAKIYRSVATKNLIDHI